MEQPHPKISIVTPVYRHGHFLERTIDSVLSQNYPNLQYVIMDGGSDDNSVEIIKKYEKHLHYWCSETDRGQYDAINRGFARTSGDIMAWINSDDMYFPWTLRTIASIFSQLSAVRWLTTLQPGFWDHEGFCMGFETMPGYARQAFLEGCNCGTGPVNFGYIQQESTFWRRSLWDSAGGMLRDEYRIAADFDLWARFYLLDDLYGTPSPLGGFRVCQEQRSMQRAAYADETAKALLQMHETLLMHPDQDPLASRHAISYSVGRVNAYEGRRVVRRQRDSAAGHWIVEDHLFP